MCGEIRIPRDMCAENTIPGETRIPVTPVPLELDILHAGAIKLAMTGSQD